MISTPVSTSRKWSDKIQTIRRIGLVGVTKLVDVSFKHKQCLLCTNTLTDTIVVTLAVNADVTMSVLILRLTAGREKYWCGKR